MFGWFKKKPKIKEAFKEADKYVQEKASEAAIESMIPEVKEKPKHIDCECAECIKRITSNAK